MNATAAYVLGHSEAELERLKLQASIIGGVTGRLIRECGIAPGWSVLEVGCGAGDVTLLLAEAVGPSGKVLAFDREAKAIETTRARASMAGHSNVQYVVGSDIDFPGQAPFDAVFGRYVLIHQDDPARLVRDAAGVLRKGGVVAFHELIMDHTTSSHSFPAVTSFETLCHAVTEAFRGNVPSPDIGRELVRIYCDAGLQVPHVTWECLVSNWDSPMVNWLLSSLASMRKHLTEKDLNEAMRGDPQALLEKIQSELREANAQVVTRPQVCAWSIRP
jgi:SAM-dependent methyltransferase